MRNCIIKMMDKIDIVIILFYNVCGVNVWGRLTFCFGIITYIPVY